MASPKIEKYLKMVEAFPGSPLPRFSLGSAYLEEGQAEQAVAELERCIAAQPEWAACLISLGDAYAALGKKAQAGEALRKARAAAMRQGHGSMAQEAQDKLEELGFDD
jgi:predicted Zn-dependent protease